MKMPIRWHKECLQRKKEHLLREEKKLLDMIESVERTRSSVKFYEGQIAEAEEKKKDGFDSERFGRNTGFVA